MQCVILAGGLATRMRPMTVDVPKTLLPVAGRPFADLQLRWLADQGVDDVVYAIGHLGDQIRAFVGDGQQWSVRVRYVDEGEELRGTAGALRLAFDEGVLDDAFLVLYGDSYLTCDIAAIWRAFTANDSDALMTVFENNGRFDRSNVRYRDGIVEEYDKTVADPVAAGMHHIDYGLSALRREIVAALPGETAIDLAEIFTPLSREGRVAGFPVVDRFYEIGSPQGLADLETLLR
jgi:NDP-sugar pyrophosphorylase family protein